MAERSAFTTLNQDTATVSSKEEIVQQLMSLGIQKGMVLLVQDAWRPLDNGFFKRGNRTAAHVTGDTEGNGTSGSGRPAETGLFNWR